MIDSASECVCLVVEDEWLLRLEMVDELRGAGWDVREAASGERALEIIDGGERVDLLITDIRLPGSVDGWQVAERCRGCQPEVPVIYVSANPVVEARRVDGSVFLTKPCNIAELLTLCRALRARAH